MAFGVTKGSIPISEAGFHKPTNVGIHMVRVGNLVPEYEEREAAVFVHCSWNDWQKLHWYDRAASVAQHRTHNLIEALANDEMSYQTHKASSKPKPTPRRRR